jgi:hypothetical protein
VISTSNGERVGEKGYVTWTSNGERAGEKGCVTSTSNCARGMPSSQHSSRYWVVWPRSLPRTARTRSTPAQCQTLPEEGWTSVEMGATQVLRNKDLRPPHFQEMRTGGERIESGYGCAHGAR